MAVEIHFGFHHSWCDPGKLQMPIGCMLLTEMCHAEILSKELAHLWLLWRDTFIKIARGLLSGSF